MKERLYDAHTSVSEDVLWLAAAKPTSMGNNMTPEQEAAAAAQSLISGKPKIEAAIPEVKNTALATMFPVLAHLFIQMLDTIHALHQRSSTIHYDIKCDNFFLDFADTEEPETDPLVKEALASLASTTIGTAGQPLLHKSLSQSDYLSPSSIATHERLKRLNLWAEEALMTDGTKGIDGTEANSNMVKVRLGDFGESYINAQFAPRQAANAQTQKARLDRYRRLFDKQKMAQTRMRQSAKLGRAEISDDEDPFGTRNEEEYMSDDLSDHFIGVNQTALAGAQVGSRAEFVADDDRYESPSDEGNEQGEDRRHSSDPESELDDADQFEVANKRSTQIFSGGGAGPVTSGFTLNTSSITRRMSFQPPQPQSARSGSGNRSLEPQSARPGSRTFGDSPNAHTPISAPQISAALENGKLPPSMHLKFNQGSPNGGLNANNSANNRTPVSARYGNGRRGGPMILQLALAHTSRVVATNNNGGNGSAPNSARPAQSARAGPMSARGNAGRVSTTSSKLDRRYARGTELIRPPELLLPHKFLADRRRRTHRTGYESDIWAVGCLLFEVLTGDFLFREEIFAKMLHRVTNADAPLLEEEHKAQLNNDSDLINFMHFVLTRDPQRRPLLTEVRRRFVLLAQKKLAAQYANVCAHLTNIVSDPTDTKRVGKLAHSLGFSAKIPSVLTKKMMLPVECRASVLNWTIDKASSSSVTVAAARASGSEPQPTTAPTQADNTGGGIVAKAPTALSTFHHFIVHSLLANEVLPLYAAWKGAQLATRRGLTGVCLPIAEADHLEGAAALAPNNASPTSPSKKDKKSAAATTVDLDAADIDNNPRVSDETVEAILETSQSYNLAATVAAQRVNGYKRDAMVGARLWETVEREKLVAAATTDYGGIGQQFTSPLNGVIGAASIADAMYGSNPIVNITNLVSIIANSYLLLGLETDDADVVVPELPIGDEGGVTSRMGDSDDEAADYEDTNDLTYNGTDTVNAEDGASEESLANSVVSEFLDNAARRPELSPFGLPSPRPILMSAGQATSRKATADQSTMAAADIMHAAKNQKPQSSLACSCSIRALQLHGITHILTFGPLPGVAKHFHYLDMSTVLSKYETEVAALQAAAMQGNLEALLGSSSSSVASAPNKRGGGAKASTNPPGIYASASGAAAASAKDEAILHKLRPQHNAFVSWMVHGAARVFCDHAASIFGRVLVVPMVIMPTAIPRWVPVPLTITCVPEVQTPGGGSAPATVSLSANATTVASPRGTLMSPKSTANSAKAYAQASAAATASPTQSVDLTLVWLLIHLTQTHRVSVITAMNHIAGICPILFQAHPQHRYLLDASSGKDLGLQSLSGVSPTLMSASNSPQRGGATPSAFDNAQEPSLTFVRASAPVVIDVMQSVQAAVSIMELYRMAWGTESVGPSGALAPPPLYLTVSSGAEINVPGLANPLFGPIGGSQTVRRQTQELMELAFSKMYTTFEKKARSNVKKLISNASPALKATLPYNDGQSMFNLVLRFVAKHILSEDGTASAPRVIRPKVDDPSLTDEERRKVSKALLIYSSVGLKLRLQWHRCLCGAKLYPTTDIAPSTGFFKEGMTPLFASEHLVATQKLVLFDRHPAPVDQLPPAEQLTGFRNARPQGLRVKHHANLLKHAKEVVNERMLAFAAKIRYVHGEIAVRNIFPAATTAACALAPQTNLLRCTVAGSSGNAPYSFALSAAADAESTQWQPVARRPSTSADKDKPYSPAFTAIVSAMEGFLQQESITNRKRQNLLSTVTTAAPSPSPSPAKVSTALATTNSSNNASFKRSEGLDPVDIPVITNVAVALAEVVLASINVLCSFPTTASESGCPHCGMLTHVRLPNDLPAFGDLTPEEKKISAEEGRIISSRVYAVCPQGLTLTNSSNAHVPDPLVQSWFVHQHLHPRPE
eukprot:GILJ01011855.1.p1 GENE.GILJ01011855.1~~GILJ01011855.1.p1  ORF type:complete len:1959 (+),score=372.88 GILJ01011855.1:144-5879(+)